MLAYHNDVAIKEKYLARIRAHSAADEIVKGKYWEKGKGCAIGCTIHGNDHGAYETELGIPQIIARLEDGIFEGLPNEEAKKFPAQFLEAIPVGADLSMVWPRFSVWLLSDVIKFANSNSSKEAVLKVIELYQKKIEGVEVSRAEWRTAAYAAASAAADAATYTATYTATYAAAYAAYAASADADAAYAASAASSAISADAAYAAARSQARLAQRDKLLELLRECE